MNNQSIVNSTELETRSQLTKIEILLLFILYSCLLLTGVINQIILSFIIIIISSILVFRNKAHYVFPTMIFYYSQLGIVLGFSVFRIFTFVFIIYLLIKKEKKIFINRGDFIVLIVYFLYCLLTLANYNLRNGLFALFDVICLIILSRNYLNNENKLKEFFTQYVLVAVIAFITGIITHNVMDTTQHIGGDYIDMVRYMATFNDPNYMGFFYTIAIFSMICLKTFKKTVRFVLIITLYVMLFSTISVTAIIGNIILWIIYIILVKKINFKFIIGLFIGIILIVFIYNYSLQNEVPLLTNLFLRISLKIEELLAGNMDGFTTERSSLSSLHYNYFLAQNAFKMLFGGNLANSIVIDLPSLGNSAAHNEYIDLLLNVGIIGTIVLISYPILRVVISLIKFNRSNKRQDLIILLVKLIWFYYAATLTLFLDVRFIIFYFL